MARSKHHGDEGIYIYIPEYGGIQEIRNTGYIGDIIKWGRGPFLRHGHMGVSDTAPLAAANSFGSGL